jgi:CHAD domain-containing protein
VGLSDEVAVAEADAGADADAGDRPALLLGDPPGAIVASDTFGDAGRKAMWPHVERLLRFEQSLADATKTDDLKRYRVATRRLRAALRLFVDAWPGKRVRKLRDELGELGRGAGTVRDLDVRIADLEGWAAAQDDEAGTIHIRPLVDAWRGDRERAATELLDRIGTGRHRRLLRDVVEFAEGEVRLTADGRRAVRDTAASQIWKAFEQLRERGSHVNWTDLPATHEVRIDAKRLRYSLEFLGDVLPPDRDPLIERLVRLQDHLGAINDAATVAAAARATLLDRRGDLEPDERASIERYAADREHDIATLQAGIPSAWDPIAAASFARRLGRTVVIV